jgi:hypothetical protein
VITTSLHGGTNCRGGAILFNAQSRRVCFPAQARTAAGIALLSLVLSGCAYRDDGPIDAHYHRYKAQLPERDKVFVCSSYGCRTQTPFRFKDGDIAHLKSMLTDARTATPNAERKAVATTLAWMEQRVGDEVGTSADRPADDLEGNGDPTQMDCVDVATNMTSYLLVLERHKLLRHHTVGSVYVKEDLRLGFSGWPHYAAILKENDAAQRFAVDGWLMASGKPPEIVETEKWYIDDSELLFGTKAPTASADTAPSPITTGSVATGKALKAE